MNGPTLLQGGSGWLGSARPCRCLGRHLDHTPDQTGSAGRQPVVAGRSPVRTARKLPALARNSGTQPTASVEPVPACHPEIARPVQERVHLKTGTHVVSAPGKNSRFTGVLGADDGTRTHDLLHGKRVVGSPSLRRKWFRHAGRSVKTRLSRRRTVAIRLQAIPCGLGTGLALVPNDGAKASSIWLGSVDRIAGDLADEMRDEEN